MTQSPAVRYCRIVAPERLSDRFLASGVLPPPDGAGTLLAYVFEVTKPWFSSSRVLPSLLETIAAKHAGLRPGKDLVDRFEDLLKAVNEQLNAISEAGETDWIGNLNGLILAVAGGELHFSQTGRCPTYLLQNNRIRQITDDPGPEREPHPLKTFTNLASGALQAGDRLLISNQELYNEISLDGLRRIIGTVSPAQACLTVTKELKRERNLGVSSILIQVGGEGTDAPEATEVILEDEMQSPLKKLGKRLAPHAAAARDHSLRLGAAGLKAAKAGGATVAAKAGPAAAALMDAGRRQAGKLAAGTKEQEASSATAAQAEAGASVPAVPAPEPAATGAPADAPAAGPVVEIIRPKGHVERKPANYLEGSLIPRDEFALGSGLGIEASGTPALKRVREALGRLAATRQSRRVGLLAAAIVLIGATGLIALNRRGSAVPDQQAAQTDADLAKAEDLRAKAAAAVTAKQDIQAGKDIEQAQALVNSLGTTTDAQKKRADAVWDSLTALADDLGTVTRFAQPSATFSFPAAGAGLVTGLPYFYASGGGSLMRTGRGDASATAASVALPDASDSIVSLGRSDDADTAAYLLTKKNRVYRIVQSGDTTTLSSITPTDGDFQAGDAVATYLSNVYILDGRSGLLWKYAGSGTTYAKGVSVIDTAKYDIKKGVSLAIDGSIFILKSNGSILSFTRGVQDEFSLKNLPAVDAALVQPLQIVTSADMDDLYVLDGGVSVGTRSTARVLAFTKDGTFVRQYAFPADYVQVKAFDIDPKEKKLWITDGQKVSEFDI